MQTVYVKKCTRQKSFSLSYVQRIGEILFTVVCTIGL